MGPKKRGDRHKTCNTSPLQPMLPVLLPVTAIEFRRWDIERVAQHVRPILVPFGSSQFQIFKEWQVTGEHFLELSSEEFRELLPTASVSLMNEQKRILQGFTTADVPNWGVADTLSYVTTILSKYPPVELERFRSGNINGSTFLKMTKEEFRGQLGLSLGASRALCASREFSSTEGVLRSSPISMLSAELPGYLNELYASWNEPYYGDSVDALEKTLIRYEGNTESEARQLYAKMLPIIQSSGMGKSRLVDELSRRLITTTFTLRQNESSGYPPGDPEVTAFVRGSFSKLSWFVHGRAVALMAGIVQQILSISGSSTDPKATAAAWRECLAPQQPENSLGPHVGSNSISDYFATARSPERKRLAGKVVDSATNIFNDLVADPTWKGMFDKDPRGLSMQEHAIVQAQLLHPAREIRKKFCKEGRPVIIAFDEAALFFSGNESQPEDELMSALRRVLGLLKIYPIWTLLLSTSSCVSYFALPEHKDPSGRINTGFQKRVDPFYALMLDVQMCRRFNDSSTRAIEFTKPLEQFATAHHMTLYGRPLWSGYRRHEPQTIRGFVLGKLLTTSGNALRAYNPSNIYHVFAVLAARVSLDPCLNTEEAADLAREAVNSHLRIILDLHPFSGRMTTVTPVEPIVAEAAAFLLMENDIDGKHYWVQSIKSLVQKLLNPGLIEKGLRGELFARIVLVLGRDYYIYGEVTRLGGNHLGSGGEEDMGASGAPIVEPTEEDEMMPDADEVSLPTTNGFDYARPFKVVGFLQYLLGWQDLDKIPSVHGTSHHTRTSHGEPITLGVVFQGAFMNFSHFTSTDTALEPENMQALLHNLMHTQSALQLKFQQIGYDLLIPIYLGNPKDAFNPTLLTAMLIQIKNRQRATTFVPSADEIHRLFSTTHNNPIIVALFDVGLKDNSVKVVESCRPDVYAFYASGRTVFPVLSGDHVLAHHCGQLLDEVYTSQQDDILRRMCQRNARYNTHTWEERFPNLNQ